MKWLLIMHSEHIPINGPMFKEKAQEFAAKPWILVQRRMYFHILTHPFSTRAPNKYAQILAT